MRKSAITLGLLLLLLLSGCRPTKTPGGETAVPPKPTTSNPIGEETPPPPAETAPQDTPPTPEVTPAPEGTPAPEPPSAPTYLTAEELNALGQKWQVTYASRFAGYEAFQIAPDYWFADYKGEGERIAFTSSDGGDGTISFLSADGIAEPISAIALLLEQELGNLILIDRGELEEKIPQRMAAMESENLTEATALDYFLRTAKTVPALTENMWYCASAEDVGYILMLHNGVYRLQRMAAMLEYVKAPEFRVNPDFDAAKQAYGWFHTAPMDPATQGLGSMLELRTYLKTLFSDEIVDTLLGLDYYTEVEGILTASPFPPSEPLPEGTVTVTVESPTRIRYTHGVDYIYEQVGERWLFTQFPVAE